jgi:hypothetical protein
MSAPQELSQVVREFLAERTSLLMRHEDVATHMRDYDINNAYQYIIAREQTHVLWLQHAMLDLNAPIPADPSRDTVTGGKGDAWKALASEDAQKNAAFVEKWRPRVELVTNKRHKGMLNVILGEMLEHKRLFDQAAAGRRDLIGTSLAINDHPGDVLGTRWMD